jgi:cytoskeletal protein RodZ
MIETIGQRLKKAREGRYLSLEKASAETRIRTVFLQALEADDFSVMPSAAQGRGFLRNYADYLDLNIDEIIAELQQSAPPPAEVSGPLPQVNLVETEVPPLTDSVEEKPAPPFWTRWLARRTRAESTPQPLEELQPAEVASVEETEAAGEILSVEAEQAEVKEETQTGLFAKLTSIFQRKVEKQEVESISDVELTEEIKTVPSVPTLPADIIFAEIGAQLRERRELISLTLDEVERHTKLRAVFVKALEEGSFENLPSPVQTRGMLLNYATFLDLDVDAILLRFADALQARRHEKYAETPREKIQTQVNASIPFLRTYLAGDFLFGTVMIAVLIALAIWGVGRLVSLQDEEEQPQVPLVVDVLGDLSSPTPTPEFDVDPSLPTATPGLDALLLSPVAPAPLTNANVTVSVFALERVFVRISVDGSIAFEGRMAPGEVKVFEADNQVVILTGNASALRITYNGQDLGLMGGAGEVVSRVYLETGVVTPTATIPPTPTNTPPVTPTFTPTITPSPTVPVD